MTAPHTDPVSIIFLSCDLTGSTRFKQRQDLKVPWQKVFLQFYREFPQRVATTQVALGTTELNFELWKPVGDELIYSCVVESEGDVYNAVRTWLKAMRDYQLKSLNGTDMGTKGGAFIATFPGPDSRSSVPRSPGSEDSDADVFELNQQALISQDNDKYVYDYFGPSIDTGFRVIDKCTPRYFTLSVEVAVAILGRALAPGTGQAQTETHNYLLHGFVELKGVWKEQKYPIVAIDTQHDDAVNAAYSKFEHRGETSDLYDLCNACYHSDGWPSKLFLPNGTIDYYRKPPKDPLEGLYATTPAGAEQMPDDEPDNASDDLGDDLDFGLPTKGEILEGFLDGDDKIHGYAPDGNLLCGALGEDSSDPYLPPDSCNAPGDPWKNFDPSTSGNCADCVATYRELRG